MFLLMVEEQKVYKFIYFALGIEAFV